MGRKWHLYCISNMRCLYKTKRTEERWKINHLWETVGPQEAALYKRRLCTWYPRRCKGPTCHSRVAALSTVRSQTAFSTTSQKSRKGDFSHSVREPFPQNRSLSKFRADFGDLRGQIQENGMWTVEFLIVVYQFSPSAPFPLCFHGLIARLHCRTVEFTTKRSVSRRVT